MRPTTIRTLLLTFAFTATVTQHASSQFAIVASSIAEGQTSVPLVDSVYFTFNQQLPFNSLFTSKFNWEPNGHYQRTEVFLDTDRQNPRFRLLHQQNYDFSVYVFGVEAASGQRMQRPYALNYTTSPTNGNRQVSGSAQFGTRTPPSANVAAELVHLHSIERRKSLERTLDGDSVESDAPIAFRTVLSEAEIDLASLRNMPDGTVFRRLRDREPAGLMGMPGSMPQSSMQNQASANLNYTVVMLLDAFAISNLVWSPRAAAAITSTGTFNFQHVRNGTYYPIAFTFADDTGQSISHYGYYDPDGDFSPNPITVNSGNLSGIQLTLYAYQATESFTNTLLAESEALGVANDAVLRNIRGSVEANGKALSWTYTYYSPSLAKEIHVVVDPLTVSSVLTNPSWVAATTPVPRNGLIDSGAAIAVTNANGGTQYIATHGPIITKSVVGGNLLDELPSQPTELLWQVKYAAPGSPDPPFVVHVDMTTGLLYVPLPVELSRFEAAVDGSSVRLSWTTESESNNAGFEIEQQRLPDAASGNGWRTAGFQAGKGSSSERTDYRYVVKDVQPGRYQFRLKQIDIAGSISYSPIVEVEISLNDALVLEEPWPNPAMHTVNVQFGGQRGKQATVVLYDVLGRVVATLFEGTADGTQLEMLSLNVESLPSGAYFLRASVGTSVRTRRLVVSH